MRIGPFGIWEILIILVVILLLFGPKRLPELAKNVGQSVREFRKGIKDMKNDIEMDISDDRKETVTTTSTPPKAPTVPDRKIDNV
ncbi:MAG: twin-arginine translocase TatA/TatE family subunit [Deinococcota bacterium]|jgi:sec-independent protein translocase protein TatA|nr:twin-arginine translocase TatA/TatE family subunit [Deinococcota bacterium]